MQASGINSKPEILAPAGSKEAFLAALDAGADSIYCGLQILSARMQAENFSLQELSGLSQIAAEQGCKVYITLNSLIKPDELQQAAELLHSLQEQVQPQALILQDIALLDLARQTGLQAKLHLSTLAACSSPRALAKLSSSLGIKRVVLPRELTLDEIKMAAAFCPDNLGLEVFVHGALCYAVSGRCYWSSYLGGKSGLRGRCVQPCRRIYTASQGQKGRFFSCLDLSLDVLAKTLLQIPQIRAWKIEGRKKGAHYVYYTVQAYKLFRDYPGDSQAKKTALQFLQDCLGRKGSHYYFLPQSPKLPFAKTREENCSGLFVGLTDQKANGSSSLRTRRDLLPGDLLRIGVQDQAGHALYRANRFTAKGKKLQFPGKWRNIPAKTPVFLVDRQDLELKQRLQRLRNQLSLRTSQLASTALPRLKLPRPCPRSGRPVHMQVLSHVPQDKLKNSLGLWLSTEILSRLSPRTLPRVYFWLPPVLWPQEEQAWAELISRAINSGAKAFVLNSPWQKALFPASKTLELWAGPFCNLSNALALKTMAKTGFTGAFASPELNKTDLLQLSRTSPLPLGLVIKGFWPLCISRTLHPDLQPKTVISSPKQEKSWIQKAENNYCHYPVWQLDLSAYYELLAQEGFSLFAWLKDTEPAALPARNRSSSFNWHLELL